MSSLVQNCGGKYIWKIVGFSHHLQDARNGKITSLESPPIYTSQQEYKFSMHFFPKGINGGDGRHFGLFVGMMQGEYDTVLEWPFGGRISLTIMGQSTDVNGCRHDISGTLALLSWRKEIWELFRNPLLPGDTAPCMATQSWHRQTWFASHGT